MIHDIIERWVNEGKKPLYMSPMDMDVLYRVMIGESRTFINSNVKKILDRCKVATIAEGVGWRLA